jgi:arylsulfatase A-like enzyme
LVPTLLDLMGQDVPDHLQGSSRKSVFEGDAELTDDVFMQWHGGVATISLGDAEFDRLSEIPWRSMVSGSGDARWKLNLSPDDLCELYDLSRDPMELVNLYDRPEHAERVADMTGRMRAWQVRVGDDLDLK